MTKHPQSLKLVNCSVDMRAGAHLAARNAGRNSSMQLTRAADYALRAMIHLASLPAAERALLPQMALQGASIPVPGRPCGFASRTVRRV